VLLITAMLGLIVARRMNAEVNCLNNILFDSDFKGPHKEE
jgi:hypothetical protein